MNSPLRLYKYEPLNAQTLRNIKGQILYFGSPLNFNDPYDCALTPRFKPLSDEEVESLRAFYLAQERLSGSQREEFATSTTEELRGTFARAAASALRDNISRVLTTCGITCFSELNSDLLMWSHYGGRYKGICLEFDTRIEPFDRVRPVNYVSELPQLDVADMLMNGNLDQAIDLFCTKSASWAYEKEWRALHKVAGTKYVYPAEALTGIYFGPDIDGDSLEIVCLVLAGQNESVMLYRGERSTTEFRVLFHEFKYTSYLQAKKTGLRE